MGHIVHTSIVALLLILAPPTTVQADPGRGQEVSGHGYWLPSRCQAMLHVAGAQGELELSDSAEERWNLHYRRGFGRIEERDLEAAERDFCLALDAARVFEPHDLRFAETLDELGLVAYLRGDDAQAEAIQGAATVEILLALGPPARDQTAEERERCGHNLATYLGRLGHVFERQGRTGSIAELKRAPFLLLGKGYVPARALAGRLDWLISRYLLAEDMAAADWLRALRERLRSEAAEP